MDKAGVWVNDTENMEDKKAVGDFLTEPKKVNGIQDWSDIIGAHTHIVSHHTIAQSVWQSHTI